MSRTPDQQNGQPGRSDQEPPPPGLPSTARSKQQFLSELETAPHSFSFFFAARLFECLHDHLPAIGYSRTPKDDPVRFSQAPRLTFAPSSIRSFEQIESKHENAPRKNRLGVDFMGLTGPNGPLPLTLTEFIYCRKHGFGHPDSITYTNSTSALQGATKPDPTLADFLDLFNHRAISLFYRAWASARKTTDFDRPDDRRFSGYFRALIGMGTPGLEERVADPDPTTGDARGITDAAKLYFSGHYSCQTRHPSGLSSILSDYFRIPVQIVEFVGHWLPLPQENQCRLGESPSTGTLGDSLIVGTRYWDCQLRCCIRLGPMPLTEYQKLLPGGNSHQKLESWVRHYIGDELFVDVQLVLDRHEVPDLALGKSGQLGYTSWIRSKPHKSVGKNKKTRWTKTPPLAHDPDDLVAVLQ